MKDFIICSNFTAFMDSKFDKAKQKHKSVSKGSGETAIPSIMLGNSPKNGLNAYNMRYSLTYRRNLLWKRKPWN